MLGNVKFKGVDSSDFGLFVNYSNIEIKPFKRNSVISVIGKDGSQVFSDKHDSYEIVLDCRIKGTNNEKRIKSRQISAWLQGSGELILGIETDVKYQAVALNNISTSVNFYIEDFSMSFLVQPIKTSIFEERLKWGTAHVTWGMAHVPWGGANLSFDNIASGDILTVENIGNYEASPLMKISGQATTLSITDDNGVNFTFNNLNGTIYVDSKTLLVYSETTVKVNEILSSNSEFITFNIGANTIDVTGMGFVGLEIEFQNASAYI